MGTKSGGILLSQPAEDMITDHNSNPFPDPPPDSNKSSTVTSLKMQKAQSMKRSADFDSMHPSDLGSRRAKNPNCSTSNSTHLSTSSGSSTTTCLILRQDHKALPFNFFNVALRSWSVLKCLLPNSLERNQKGTVIGGQIDKNKLVAFHASPQSFELNNIKYLAKVPQTHTPFTGEVVFDLNDIDDRSLLSISESEIKDLLTISSSSNNSILSVRKLFPRKTLPIEDPAYLTVQAMRISIECSTSLPERVFFENVSLKVFPFILPPTRCFCCQRYGHGAISCRRSARCAKCSSTQHITAACDSDKQFCFACQAPHTCSSVRCKFYKAALAIAALVQDGRLHKDQASIHYAALYSEPDKVPNAPPLITASPILTSRFPSPNPISYSSMQSWPKPATSSTSISSSFSSLFSTPPHHAPSLSSLSQSDPLTSAQKAPKKVPIRPTPPHLTPEYSQALKGDLWFNSQGACSSPQTHTHLPSSPLSAHPPSSHQTSSPGEQTSSETESPIFTLLKSFLKPLLQKLLDWILSSLPTDSPTASIFSTLLQSLSASLSSSS